MVRACSNMGELRNIETILIGKSETMRALIEQFVDGRVVLKWISNKIGYNHVNWNHFGQDRDQ
jgi:hypothetical protein